MTPGPKNDERGLSYSMPSGLIETTKPPTPDPHGPSPLENESPPAGFEPLRERARARVPGARRSRGGTGVFTPPRANAEPPKRRLARDAPESRLDRRKNEANDGGTAVHRIEGRAAWISPLVRFRRGTE